MSEKAVFVLVVLLVVAASGRAVELEVGFYRESCPEVESIVKQHVTTSESGVAAGLVRLHFHDCFVRGCDGSVLIDSTLDNRAEKNSPPNDPSLRAEALQVIDAAKANIEAACPATVSCADIVAFAARDAVVLAGGVGWEVPAGRRDGRISRADEASSLPGPSQTLDKITAAFAKLGLTQQEMIALLGSHSIGRSHCTSFINRLYNFNSTDRPDPSLDAQYASALRRKCPRRPSNDEVVDIDSSPAEFENSYYANVLRNRGLFTSDQTLTTSSDSLSDVKKYANSQHQWLLDFSKAMIKMSQIGVLTGPHGEIRSNCRLINSS